MCSTSSNQTKPLVTELEFTRVYRENYNADIALRELRCLEVLLPARFQPLQNGDRFAGRVKYPLCGFSPQPGGYCYYCQEGPIREILARGNAKTWTIQVEDMLEFWKTENTKAKTRAVYPGWVAETLFTDGVDSIAAAYPLYRMGGTQLDYGKILRLGLPGLKCEIKQNFISAGDGKNPLCTALLGTCDLLADIAYRYAEQIRITKDINKKEREALIRSLKFIPERAPETFSEAVQLLWIASLASGSWNYGRLDVLLGGFLVHDLDSGILDEETALDLLCSLWRLMYSLGAKFDNRVIIGGRGRSDEKAADRFALLAMEAARRVKLNQPQLSLRFYNGQNPLLLKRAYDVLAEGITFPLLYNDDVNIPSVSRAMNIPESEAEDYLPFGCGEYMIWKRGIATPSGAINLAKCLELALHNGKCMLSGQVIGVPTGDATVFSTFEDVWHAYTIQVEHQTKALALQEKIEYEVVGREAAFLFFTLLSDDCIKRCRAIFNGGIRYLAGTLETYGNTDVADALTTIRRAVFEDKSITMTELLNAMSNNWNGNGKLRAQLLALPKYGNDNKDADEMAVRVHEHICRFTRDQAKTVGLDYYLVVLINNSMNVTFGLMTAALPDGRMTHAPLANGNNPVAGRDHQGVTAFLQSLLKLSADIHAGAVQNMKFSKTLFKQNRIKLEALLNTYWNNGGAQAMITVVNRGDLEAAVHEPEKWGHLMVRVGGFSERFVNLSCDIQQHILERTLNE